jgi:type IV pilus assembly protein PilA
MTDWYYHAPGQGRVGPLSAEQLRAGFRERRVDRETLVWHAGLREWQPLERQFDALELDGVRPDASQPPPLPPPSAPQIPKPTYIALPVHSAQPRSDRSGCLIAALVAAGVGAIAVGILAAIALPAYRHYVDRARQAERDATGAPTFDADDIAVNDEKARALLAAAMTAGDARAGCPEEFELESAQIRRRDLAGDYVLEPDGGDGAQCRYRVTLPAFGDQRERMPLRYTATRSGDCVSIACAAPDLPPPLRPPGCTD